MSDNQNIDFTPVKSHKHFSKLLSIQIKLSLREPYILGGIIFPVFLLILFWYIGNVSGSTINVGNTNYTVLDLYIPTIMVIGFITIAISFPNTLVRDREIGYLRRVSTTPVSPSRLLAVGLIINIITAILMVLIVIFGGEFIFNTTLNVNIPLFIFSICFSIAVVFSIGLFVAAITPNQAIANAVGGLVFFVLLFFSGLWIQPDLLSEPFKTIMLYSPTGGASKMLFDSVFNIVPPIGIIIAMIIYIIIFTGLAIHFFRWE